VERRKLGRHQVSPLGFGAMRLTGPNVFGPPRDRDEAIAVLREAVGNGVDHIDTAQFYGPDVVNELIHDALHPYPAQLVLVSKVGARRDGRGGVLHDDEPEALRRAIETNLRTLGVETLPVVNLRRMRDTEPDAFFDDQLGAMVKARDDGLIESIGLSNITLAHLLAAMQVTEVACVQNYYHIADRRSQPVLEVCTRRGIAFVPFAPLGFGQSGPSSVLGAPPVVAEAERLAVTPAQLVLAWTRTVAPNVLLIPGTSSLSHLHENLASATVDLDREAIHRLGSA
jgi:pyridoxine 4-dehydrogenase